MDMLSITRICTAAALLALSAPHAHAGLGGDLKRCTAASGNSSARACTRVIKSGRLRRSHRYIAFYNRGWAHRNSGNLKRALEDFDKAVRLKPNYGDTYYSRAGVLFDLGETTRSLEDLDRYVKLKRNSWHAYYNRAVMLRRMHKYERALDDLNEAAKIKPDAKQAGILRALLTSDLGDHQGAVAQLSRLINAHPKNAGAYYARATVMFRISKMEDAQTDLTDALRLRKHFPAAHVLLGRIYERKSMTEAAKKSYKKALLGTRSKSPGSKHTRDTARARLTALARNVTKEPKQKAQPAKVSSIDCRRFIPSAAITITVPCD